MSITHFLKLLFRINLPGVYFPFAQMLEIIKTGRLRGIFNLPIE